MTTLHLTKSIDRSPLRLGLPPVQPIWIMRSFFLLPLALACFALSPQARADCHQGCSPNNTFLGFDALINTNGGFNTAIGAAALSNTTGSSNTAIGAAALAINTTGEYNTASGDSALYSNTTGGYNTATGSRALLYNYTGGYNTANGYAGLFSNTTGFSNTASGYAALVSNTTGNSNTATGVQTLFFNTTGINNTANGVNALLANTSGSYNTANGRNALLYNTSGIRNTAEGSQALLNNTGSNNIGLGYNAGSSLTVGSGNVCIGAGVLGVAAESNSTRIKNVYASVAADRAVYVNSDNKIGTLVSSRRFKDEIKPMDKASEAILSLRPVSFRYKKEIDRSHALSFGLIAEEVANIDPDLVTPDRDGKPETVRYEAVNAMLLNEFLKEHRKVEDLKKELQATVSQQQKQIDALTAGLQKVSAQVETSKPAMQTVLNNQ